MSDQLQTEVAAAASCLLETWERLASAHITSGSRCSCGAHGITLRLSDFEQDIGDYLRNEAEQYQRRDVLVLLERAARDGNEWNIVRFLERVAEPEASLDRSAAAFVMERLPRTVQSFEELHRRR